MDGERALNEPEADFTILSDIQPAGGDSEVKIRGNHESDEKSFLALSDLEST